MENPQSTFLTEYFYGDEAEQFTYFRIPRLLITSPHFSGISIEAKLLYGLMLDRMGLSCKKGWHESDGKVFIYYTIEEICKDLNCASEKAVKLVAELEGGSQVKYRCVRARKMENGDIVEDERKQTIMYDAGLEVGGLYSLRPGKLYRVVGLIDGQDRSRISLIERRRQGQGKPTKIYVKRFTTKRNSRNSEIENQEIRLSKYRDFDNRNSRNSIIEAQDFRLSNSSYTEYSNPDISQTESVNPSIGTSTDTSARVRAGVVDGQTDGQAVRERIKKQIDYEILPFRLDGWALRQADELLELMVEVALTRSPTVQIGRAAYPIDYVQERFAKIGLDHIEAILRGLKENEGRVINVRAYLLASLFNSVATMDNATSLSCMTG